MYALFQVATLHVHSCLSEPVEAKYGCTCSDVIDVAYVARPSSLLSLPATPPGASTCICMPNSWTSCTPPSCAMKHVNGWIQTPPFASTPLADLDGSQTAIVPSADPDTKRSGPPRLAGPITCKHVTAFECAPAHFATTLPADT